MMYVKCKLSVPVEMIFQYNKSQITSFFHGLGIIMRIRNFPEFKQFLQKVIERKKFQHSNDTFSRLHVNMRKGGDQAKWALTSY